MPEIKEAIREGRLQADGDILTEAGSVRVTKAALEPVWYMPGIAECFGVGESDLRRNLFEQSGGMFPELITRRDFKVFMPPIGGITVYCFGNMAALTTPVGKLACRVHDECNGSDVFGSDICTCRPYLAHGVEVCIQTAQEGGAGLIIYNRKEGRALGEVTKFLVYNARKRQEGGDRAETYFERTECVAGVQDLRFQELMPDVLHWLGITEIDHFVSMSDQKHDAISRQGIKIFERVSIPDHLVPLDAHVEIEAKKAAGYYNHDGPSNEEELAAGAGDAWRYVESETGETFTRSEGLAVASVDLFASGLLSGDPDAPFRVDATALAALTEHDLAETFQVTADNPLIGMAGRMNLLHGLADVVHARTDLFGSKDGTRARVGNLLDSLVTKADDGSICASDILQTILDGLGALWPGHVVLGGINLGDTWRHPAVQTDDPSTGLVPFHKLSQWLTYSLAEPLEACGITVTNLDGLTGLAEYRNGGLFVDLGVLRPKHGLVTTEPHAVDSEIVVEWRALTVALLDRIANPLRQELGVDSEAFPLAKVLEGGTWQAGRRIAAERRTGGGPPIRVLSEGTVF